MTDRQPAQAFPVGEHLLEEIEARGWTLRETAAKLDWSLNPLRLVLFERQPLLIPMAYDLMQVFDVSEDFWLNLDRQYREWQARTLAELGGL